MTGAGNLAEGGHLVAFRDPEAVEQALQEAIYFADEGLATAIFLAGELGKPLLLEGEPGVGKTAVATALASTTGRDLVRLQCYEGLTRRRVSTNRTTRGNCCTCAPMSMARTWTTFTAPSSCWNGRCCARCAASMARSC